MRPKNKIKKKYKNGVEGGRRILSWKKRVKGSERKRRKRVKQVAELEIGVI